MSKKTVEVTIKVNLELLTDVLGGGQCSYWADVRAKGQWYQFREHNAESGGVPGPWVYVGKERMIEAFSLMASECPYHFGQILQENGDCESGDVLTQIAVLGEIKYG